MKNKFFMAYAILIFTCLVLSVILAFMVYKDYIFKSDTTTISEVTKKTSKKQKKFTGERKPINIYVFYGEECAYCYRLHLYLATLEKDSSINYKFNIIDYEVWHDSENNALMKKVGQELNYNITGVPFYIIGEEIMGGYSSLYNEDIVNAINKAYEEQSDDLVAPVGVGNIKKFNSSSLETIEEE